MSAAALALRRNVATLAAGVLFGFGLSVAGMVHPEVVLSFLRFSDYGLMLVMGGAVVVVAMVFNVLPKVRHQPLLGGQFETHIRPWNLDTAMGSALFGVGWGLSGVCPGPALASIGMANWDLLWALGGIALGALVQGLREK